MFDKDLIKNAEKINDFLEDDLSKKVFRYRIFANLTGDVRYIHRLLSETGTFEFDKAYEMYKRQYEIYHIFPKMDVLSFLQTRDEERKVVFFGAGHDAEIYYSLLETAGIVPEAVLDNGSDKDTFHGITIYKPGDYKELSEVVIIITSMRFKREMYWELKGRGVPEEQIFVPDVNGMQIFSLREYFDETVWTGRENEIFVDAGAYNLGTSYDFTRYAKSYEQIYAFEPDLKNIELCEDNQKRYGLKNLKLYRAGLWDKDGTLKFSRGGDNGTGTAVSDAGVDELEVRSLDSVLNGDPCTFIKMDIEGSELMALKGAEKTIRRCRPRLAICLYHKPMDIIDIPLYIKELVPEYKIKIRHYSTWFYDTVLYAYI